MALTAELNRARQSRYDHLTHDELVRLLEARDQRDATRFGLVWEANEIERDKAVNSDFVALDLVPEPSSARGGDRRRLGNLVIEGDNFDALRYLRMSAEIASEEPLITSPRNVYGVVPPGLNSWEQSFAELLERDTHNIVL